MKKLATDLGYFSPIVLQSMYIFKQPKIGGKVRPHQDSTFIHTVPNTTIGFWMALEDATKENGCLWAIPGSQKDPIKRRFVLSADGKSVHFEPAAQGEDWPDLSKFIPLECKKVGAFIGFI